MNEKIILYEIKLLILLIPMDFNLIIHGKLDKFMVSFN